MSEHKQLIEFGNQESEEICWKSESGSLLLDNLEEYSSFFKSRWNVGDQNWSMSNNQNEWTQQCFNLQGTSFLWAILISEDEGEQYLGLCGKTELNSTKFVKKKKEAKEAKETNSEKLTLSICDSDCWDLSQQESYSDGEQVLLTQEKEDNWKKILFYKN